MNKICHALMLNNRNAFSGAAIQARYLCQYLEEYPEIGEIRFLNFVFLLDGQKDVQFPGKNIFVKRGNTFLLLHLFHIFIQVYFYLRSLKIDLVHIHGFYPIFLPLIFAAKFLKVPVVQKITLFHYPGGDDPLTWKRKGVRGKVMLWGLNFAERIIIQNNENKSRLVELRKVISKTQVITNGVDVNRFEVASENKRIELRKKHNISVSDFLIIFVGRLGARKGFDVVLEIFEKVLEKNINAKLIAIGPECGQKYKTESPDIIRKGVVPADAMPEYYSISDIFVLPSRGEGGFPNSLLEAMAAGLPCLISRDLGAEEIIEDGIEGFHLGEDMIDDAVRRIECLYNNISICQEIGNNARKKILRDFSLESVSNKYLILYRNLRRKN